MEILFIATLICLAVGALLWVISLRRLNGKNIELTAKIDENNLTIKELMRDLNWQIKSLQEAEEKVKLLQDEVVDYRQRLLKVDEDYKEKFEAWKVTTSDQIRKDALDKSRAVIRGQATEHLAPMMIPNLNLKDYRFMGNPIDYVVFDGLSNLLDGQTDEITRVWLIDIKTGKASLNKSQRRIRDAVKRGDVSFATYNPDTEEFKIWTH